MKLKVDINPRSELGVALIVARAALAGDSNDAEHDALVTLMEALGQSAERWPLDYPL